MQNCQGCSCSPRQFLLLFSIEDPNVLLAAMFLIGLKAMFANGIENGNDMINDMEP
jgi:hypothetical protein